MWLDVARQDPNFNQRFVFVTTVHEKNSIRRDMSSIDKIILGASVSLFGLANASFPTSVGHKKHYESA